MFKVYDINTIRTFLSANNIEFTKLAFVMQAYI